MAQSADYTYLLQGLGEVMGGPLSSQLMERIWLMLGVEIAAHIENKFRSGKRTYIKSWGKVNKCYYSKYFLAFLRKNIPFAV